MRKFIFWALSFAISIIFLSGLAAITADSGIAKQYETQIQSAPLAKTSVIVERIGEFDYEEDTFSASFWITSETTSPTGNPIEDIELANSISSSIESTSQSTNGTRRIFRQRVRGIFHHPWDLSRYPFDRENLQLILRDTKQTTGRFTHVADATGSGLRKIPRVIGEWRVTGFKFEKDSSTPAKDSFISLGAAKTPAGESELIFTIRLTNSHSKGALKLLSGGIIASGIAAISYTLTPNIISNPNSRFGALTASLFAAVISMRSAYGYLGNLYDVTLVDKIYFAILAYIFFSFACASYLWRINKDPNRAHLVQRYSYIAGAASTFLLIVAIVVITILTAWA